MKCFKLKSLNHVLTFTEVDGNLVTLFNALLTYALHMIKVCKFVHPFFFAIILLEFFKNFDTLFEAYFLGGIEFIL